MPYPKIELHVHLEGTVRPATLLEIARRNDVALPADTVEGLADLYRFRDFAHFIEVWVMTTSALRSADDFRRIVVDYASEAASHGAVYIEGIFSPAEPAARGVAWEEIFEGYCDGAQDARELHGVEVRLTPDIPRGFPLEAADMTARYAVAHRERGVVGLGLGGPEAQFPPEPYAAAFALAREGGIASVPHAGEVAGVTSIRGALEALGADRIRHGIRAVDDPEMVRELAGRGTVLDVCPISNLRTGAVGSLAEHPLPQLVGAGVRCSLSTDDPAMFDTDLDREYEAATDLGLSPRDFYEAGVAGALCDRETRERLHRLGEEYEWSAIARSATVSGNPRATMATGSPGKPPLVPSRFGMAPAAISAPTAIEQALELFESERRPQEARLSDGYLDLLDAGDATAPHLSQRLLETRVMPVVYERFAHPLVMRKLGGRKTPLWSKEQKLALEVLAPSRGERVLDIACGPGNFTRTYAEAVGDALVVGLDLSRSMLAYAVSRTPNANVAYVRADACALPFRAASFPLVSCFGAMHLFEDPMRALAEMVRVLAPGGRITLMTTCETRRGPGMRGWHIFGRDQLTKAFDEHGLASVEQRVIGGWQCVSARKPQG